MSRGIAAAFAGLAIFAAAAGWLYYDYMRIPPEVVAAYEAFVDEGDPLPLAALGDRAHGVVPRLAAMLESSAVQIRHREALTLLGIIGGPEAEDELIRQLDVIQAKSQPHSMRVSNTAAPMYALALLDSPRASLRLLTFPIDRNIEGTVFDTINGAFDPVPDDPAYLLRALQESLKDADYCALVNLPRLCREYLSFERVLASEELTDFLIGNYRRYSESSAPWFDSHYTYFTLLRAMKTHSAETFVSSLPEIEAGAPYGWYGTTWKYESASEILERYIDMAEHWKSLPTPGEILDSDKSDEVKLVELLNSAPGEGTWRFISMRDNRTLMRLGGAIAPFLIGCMEQNVRSEHAARTASNIPHGQMECLYLLRRATGRNFGLNPEAWRTWWEREGREEFEIGR